MSDEYRRVRLWQVRATDKAYCFETLPPILTSGDGDAAFWVSDPKSRQVWVPRSVIGHVSRGAPNDRGVQECIVDISEWMADKLDL